jgi:hypothetical protein
MPNQMLVALGFGQAVLNQYLFNVHTQEPSRRNAVKTDGGAEGT